MSNRPVFNPDVNKNSRLSAEFFHEEDIRIETIIWLAANTAHHCDAMQELIEDDPDILTKFFGVKESDDPLEEVLCTLRDKGYFGFLVKAYTPIPYNFTETGCLASWGYSRFEWFYTELFDDAFLSSLKDWKASVHAKAKSKLEGK